MIRDMTVFLLCVCLGLASSCAVAASGSASDSGSVERVAHVERFVAAFNAQDSAAMGALVTDDVQWLSVIEQASWRVNDEERSQSSISVYEFTGDLIARVYYFPAE